MNKGRPLDPIWEDFKRKDGNKAKCLECGSESAALVERMRTHFNKYHVAKDEETPTPRKQIKIEQDGNVPSRRHILGSKIFKEQLL